MSKLDFSHLPNFDTLLYNSDNECVKSVLHEINEIKHLMYLISYIENGSRPVHKLSSVIDKKFSMPNREIRNVIDFVKLVTDTRADIIEYYHITLEKNINRATNDITDEFKNDYLALSWDDIGIKFYNEVENPSVVDKFLGYLFYHTKIDKNTVNPIYEISIYDFSNYIVNFKDKDTLDFFVTNFIECGTAGAVDSSGEYTELYSV